MTYVKKGAMIFEVEDDRVQKYINEGFKIYTPQIDKLQEPKDIKEKPLNKMTKAELEEKAVEIGLDLSDCNNNEERAKKIEDYLNQPEDEQTEGEDNGENAE